MYYCIKYLLHKGQAFHMFHSSLPFKHDHDTSYGYSDVIKSMITKLIGLIILI
jgi:hypothetical protein